MRDQEKPKTPPQGDERPPAGARLPEDGDALAPTDADAPPPSGGAAPPPLQGGEADAETEEAPVRPTGPMLLIVTCGGEQYGIPVEHVREVVEAPQVTRVPAAPKHVAGVAAVRGDILPVVDLGERLHGRPTEAAHRMVTVEVGDIGRVGMLADDVVGMIQASSADAIDAVPVDAAGALPEGVASGVYAPSDDRMIVLLDLGPLLAIDLAAKEG